jgi:hypothetical protein
MRLNESPPVDLWRVFQTAFADMQESNKALKQQMNALKKTNEQAHVQGEGDSSVRTHGRALGIVAKKTGFAPKAAGEFGSEGGSAAATLKSSGKGGLSMASMKRQKA